MGAPDRSWATLRALAEHLRLAAMRAADPAEAVTHHLARTGPLLTVGDRRYDLERVERIYVLSAGKAAVGMAQALFACLGPWAEVKAGAGLIVAPAALTQAALAWRALQPGAAALRVLAGGHPLPTPGSEEAGHAALALLRQAGPHDLVFCLLSGGASALLTAPAPGLCLADVQTATQALLRSGAGIQALNAVRKHLDLVKGGGLARIVAGAPIVNLILSDVLGDPLDVIASGPTTPDPTTYRDAWEALTGAGVMAQMPAAVVRHVQSGLRGERPETLKPMEAAGQPWQHLIVGSNRLALAAAAAAATDLGCDVRIVSAQLQGEARTAGRHLAALAAAVVHGESPLSRPVCLLAGGETTVVVRGAGRGGRAQELALAAAPGAAGLPIGLLSFGSDGVDGPTDAAGAWADGATTARAQALGLDPAAALDANDAYPFFAALGDLLITGPSGTNVNDLVFVLIEPGAGHAQAYDQPPGQHDPTT